ncbi:VWA domain-containing protein [Taibaiella koreensis]|uniref:VWA domain-containing protein n=1 Tax=Taibaiella koreensis TaxID=1268548 RepID=UPI000E59A3E6|nr:VWA domain-containing protein [Taibaiella koreensis]
MEARDNFTEQFKKAARRQEDTSAAFPSMDNIWNKVEARLDAEQQKETRRLIPFWKKGIAAAILLLAGLGLVYLLIPSKAVPDQPAYARKGKEVAPAMVPAIEHPGRIDTPAIVPVVEQRREAIVRREVRPKPQPEEQQLPHMAQAAVEQPVTNTATPASTNDAIRREKQPRIITGQVFDESGEAVPGATVVVKGMTIGTVTDADGNYELEVPPGATSLVIKGFGSKDKEIDLSTIQGPVVARLEAADQNALQEVQVYGQKIDKKSYTGSVAAMSAAEIAKRPVTNIAKALDGTAPGVTAWEGRKQQAYRSDIKANDASPRHMKLPEPVLPNVAVNSTGRRPVADIAKALDGAMPGLEVTSGGGQPGAGPDIQIRGQGSLSASQAPLIVVDGQIYSGSLVSIDPKNVASMSVLKERKATALYGARGADGVILITTKKNASQPEVQQEKKSSFFGRGWQKVKKLFKGKKSRYSSVMPAAVPVVAGTSENESYNPFVENPFDSPAMEPLSTFSIDVDNASYTNIRRFINNGQAVPKDAVRIEEMINFFQYHYPQPEGTHPFGIHTEYSEAPWNPQHRLLKIGLQGRTLPEEQLPAANLVFLIDVSGSMDAPNKLPLLKASMRLLLSRLRAQDRVAIVVYAGAAGMVLPATPGNQKEKIAAALDMLQAGGSTAGGDGIRLAYQVARENFIKDGNNRVILATDGDFNVGASSDADMQGLIEEQRKSNVFLTCLGYGMGNYKDSKMETLADKGNGNYAYIDNLEEASRFLVKAFGGTMYSIAKDVKLQIEFNPAYVQAYRLIGYENRKLRTEDFSNDAIDAGELGSGHTVTALYEIIPAGASSRFLPAASPELRYHASRPGATAHRDELATIRFRYKHPQEDNSIEIVKTIGYQPLPLASSSADYKLAAAVAWFGLQLRGSELIPDKSKEHVLALAESSLAANRDEYRTELVRLIRKAL